MKQKRINKLAILTIFALIIAVFAAAPAMAKTKYKLVKSYKNESYDSSKKAWSKEYDKVSLKYDKKGHVKQITKKSYNKGKLKNTIVRNLKNKYKKGKISQRTENDADNCMEFITSFKKEAPVKTYCDNDGYVSTHKYTYKGRYAASDVVTSYGSDADSKSTSTYKYNVTLKKGYPVKITSRFDIGSGTESTVVNFNKSGKAKGLIKSAVRNTPDYKATYSFKYKFKKGRVSVVTKSYTEVVKSDNSTYKYKERYTFTYAKKTINAKRYGSMINGTVVGMLGPDELFGTTEEDFFVTYWF